MAVDLDEQECKRSDNYEWDEQDMQCVSSGGRFDRVKQKVQGVKDRLSR